MQVSPSAGVFQALSAFFQPGPVRPQGAGEAGAPAVSMAATTSMAPPPAGSTSVAKAAPVTETFDGPPPEGPLRRGSLVDVVA